jgi:hypothetical protein
MRTDPIADGQDHVQVVVLQGTLHLPSSLFANLEVFLTGYLGQQFTSA